MGNLNVTPGASATQASNITQENSDSKTKRAVSSNTGLSGVKQNRSLSGTSSKQRSVSSKVKQNDQSVSTEATSKLNEPANTSAAQSKRAVAASQEQTTNITESSSLTENLTGEYFERMAVSIKLATPTYSSAQSNHIPNTPITERTVKLA